MLRFSNFEGRGGGGTFLPAPAEHEDREEPCRGETTLPATLPVFSRPGFTKDGESSVLGFANVPARSLRIYDWTYQYADHETWSGRPPRLPCPSRAPSSSLGTSVSLSLFDKHRIPPRVTLAVPRTPCPALRFSICLSPLIALPPASAAREAKRRLFRRECFRRNAETVLIAARLA